MDQSDLQGKDTLKSCVLGFVLSIILTLLAYVFVQQELLSPRGLFYTISGLAILQACIQVVLFLHVGKEPKPYWHLILFLAMVSVIVILIGGSLWIMANLDYNVMPRM